MFIKVRNIYVYIPKPVDFIPDYEWSIEIFLLPSFMYNL